MARQPALILTLLLLLTLFVGSALVWDSLPEHIPTHFAVDGRPDDWGEASLLGWFLLPIISALIALLFYGIGSLVRRRPQWVNMPDREKFLALPAERRAEVAGAIIGGMYWVGVMLNVMFLMIQFATWREAVGHGMPGLILVSVLLAVLSSPFILIIMLLRTQKLMA